MTITNEKKQTLICTPDFSLFANEIRKIEKKEVVQSILIFTFSGDRYLIKCKGKSDLDTTMSLLQNAMIESNETATILKRND